MPFTVFLYTGFVLALPRTTRRRRGSTAPALRTFGESCSRCCGPITGTVAIFTGLFIWNDFFLSLIYLNGSGQDAAAGRRVHVRRRVPASRWNLIFAAVIVSLVPILLFFLVAQRQLIQGFTGGIKGWSPMAPVDLLERGQDLSRRHPRRHRSQPRDRRRGVRRLRRSVRVRQDDRATDGRRARGGHRRRTSGSASDVVNALDPGSATSRWSSRTTRSTRT